MNTIISKSIVMTLVITLLVSMVLPSEYVYARSLSMPAPTLAMPQANISNPIQLKGIVVDPDDAFRMEFIVSDQQSALSYQQEMKSRKLEAESRKLIKYFLTALTVPEDEQWVNLSPYEENRIIPEALGQTVMGRDMLVQDYLLKQITSSLLHPDNEHGKQFWDKVYAEAFERYGTTEIPVDTFHKVWITPKSAKVYQHQNRAFVVDSRLKVMLERDYVAAQRTNDQRQMTNDHSAKPNGKLMVTSHSSLVDSDDLSSEIMRSIIIPALEHEVNHGETFAQLRQIYQAMILATWYKRELKNSILNTVYADKNKIQGSRHLERSREISGRDPSTRPDGLAQDDNRSPEEIWTQYVESFKQGAYDFVRDEQVTNDQRQMTTGTSLVNGHLSSVIEGDIVPRRYFSGGLVPGEVTVEKDFERLTRAEQNTARAGDNAMAIETRLDAEIRQVDGEGALPFDKENITDIENQLNKILNEIDITDSGEYRLLKSPAQYMNELLDYLKRAQTYRRQLIEPIKNIMSRSVSDYRASRQMTQLRLAQVSGVSESAIGRIETKAVQDIPNYDFQKLLEREGVVFAYINGLRHAEERLDKLLIRIKEVYLLAFGLAFEHYRWKDISLFEDLAVNRVIFTKVLYGYRIPSQKFMEQIQDYTLKKGEIFSQSIVWFSADIQRLRKKRKDFANRLSERIVFMRQQEGYSQQELADKARISRTTINDAEQGDSHGQNLKILNAIADVFFNDEDGSVFFKDDFFRDGIKLQPIQDEIDRLEEKIKKRRRLAGQKLREARTLTGVSTNRIRGTKGMFSDHHINQHIENGTTEHTSPRVLEPYTRVYADGELEAVGLAPLTLRNLWTSGEGDDDLIIISFDYAMLSTEAQRVVISALVGVFLFFPLHRAAEEPVEVLTPPLALESPLLPEEKKIEAQKVRSTIILNLVRVLNLYERTAQLYAKEENDGTLTEQRRRDYQKALEDLNEMIAGIRSLSGQDDFSAYLERHGYYYRMSTKVGSRNTQQASLNPIIRSEMKWLNVDGQNVVFKEYILGESLIPVNEDSSGAAIFMPNGFSQIIYRPDIWKKELAELRRNVAYFSQHVGSLDHIDFDTSLYSKMGNYLISTLLTSDPSITDVEVLAFLEGSVRLEEELHIMDQARLIYRMFGPGIGEDLRLTDLRKRNEFIEARAFLANLVSPTLGHQRYSLGKVLLEKANSINLRHQALQRVYQKPGRDIIHWLLSEAQHDSIMRQRISEGVNAFDGTPTASETIQYHLQRLTDKDVYRLALRVIYKRGRYHLDSNGLQGPPLFRYLLTPAQVEEARVMFEEEGDGAMVSEVEKRMSNFGKVVMWMSAILGILGIIGWISTFNGLDDNVDHGDLSVGGEDGIEFPSETERLPEESEQESRLTTLRSMFTQEEISDDYFDRLFKYPETVDMFYTLIEAMGQEAFLEHFRMLREQSKEVANAFTIVSYMTVEQREGQDNIEYWIATVGNLSEDPELLDDPKDLIARNSLFISLDLYVFNQQKDDPRSKTERLDIYVERLRTLANVPEGAVTGSSQVLLRDYLRPIAFLGDDFNEIDRMMVEIHGEDKMSELKDRALYRYLRNLTDIKKLGVDEYRRLVDFMGKENAYERVPSLIAEKVRADQEIALIEGLQEYYPDKPFDDYLDEDSETRSILDVMDIRRVVVYAHHIGGIERYRELGDMVGRDVLWDMIREGSYSSSPSSGIHLYRLDEVGVKAAFDIRKSYPKFFDYDDFLSEETRALARDVLKKLPSNREMNDADFRVKNPERFHQSLFLYHYAVWAMLAEYVQFDRDQLDFFHKKILFNIQYHWLPRGAANASLEYGVFSDFTVAHELGHNFGWLFEQNDHFTAEWGSDVFKAAFAALSGQLDRFNTFLDLGSDLDSDSGRRFPAHTTGRAQLKAFRDVLKTEFDHDVDWPLALTISDELRRETWFNLDNPDTYSGFMKEVFIAYLHREGLIDDGKKEAMSRDFGRDDRKFLTEEDLAGFFRDAAMAARGVNVDANDLLKGGIDFNPAAMDLDVEQDNVVCDEDDKEDCVTFNMTAEQMDQLQKNMIGINPVIVGIRPVTNLPRLLGIK